MIGSLIWKWAGKIKQKYSNEHRMMLKDKASISKTIRLNKEEKINAKKMDFV